MAHRATGFAKKPADAPQARATPQAPIIVPTLPANPIPLNLAPLIAPYKKQGRLSLRIERMPQLARLSQGRNNGNGSWSVGLDELDGLAFLPPDGMDQPHTLAVRVIGVAGGDGQTLAVLEYTVVPEATPKAPSDALKQLQHLHDELAHMKSTLEEREAELQQARETTANIEIEKARMTVEKALTDARTVWRRETDDELAAVLENAERRVANAREEERQQTRNAVSKAELEWKSAEAERVAEAEARWRSEAQSSSASDTKRQDETLRALQAELAAARDALEQQKSTVALAQKDAEITQRRAQSEADDLRQQLVIEKSRRKASENALTAQQNAPAKIAPEQAKQIEDLRQQLATMSARYETAKAALADLQNAPPKGDPIQAGQIESLRRQIADVSAQHEGAKAALAELQSAPAKFDPAQTKQIEDLRQQLATMTARCEVAEARANISAPDPSQTQKIEELTRSLAEVTERCKTAESIASAPNPAAPDVDAILAKARENWRSEENTRLVDAKAKWQRDGAQALSALSARAEAAEAALAAEQNRPDQSRVNVGSLLAQIEDLKTQVADRENELAYAQATLGMRSGIATQMAVETASKPRVANDDEAQERARANRRLIRDVLIAASLAFAVMLGLPHLMPLLPYDAQVTLYEMGQSVGIYPQTETASAAPTATPRETIHAEMTAVLVHGANVRSEPSSKASVLSSLTRGTGVIPLDVKGSWTRVRLEDASEGWVFSAYLKPDKPKP